MRLGQLSRKTDTKPTEILSYLKNEFDIELGSHLNTKVDDELAKKVVSKFVKPKAAKPTILKKADSIQQETEDKAVSANPVSEEETKAPIEEIANSEEETEPVSTSTDTGNEFEQGQEVDPATILNAELIKAPKIELAGPKVIGKIELPPPLEEQMVEVDGVMISKAEIANRKKEERLARREKNGGDKRRSVSTVKASRIKSVAQVEQIKKDKEAELMDVRLAHREKRISEKKKKAAKKQSTFVPKKTKKPTKKAVIKAQEIKKEQVSKPKPATWYGKLWLWFNT